MERAFIEHDLGDRHGFRVDTQVHGDVCLIRPRGELELATAPLLEAELIRVEATSVPLIDLDLTGLTFMDSSGIYVLVRAELRTRADSTRLRIIAPTGQVGRLMAISGVEEMLPLSDRRA